MAWSPVRPFNAGRFEVETPRRLRHSQFLPTSRRHPRARARGYRKTATYVTIIYLLGAPLPDLFNSI